MSDMDVIRRIAERGIKLAQKQGPEFVDLFQHMIDEAARVPSSAATDVIAERTRQQAAEGWTPEHDDEHQVGDLARAGASYAISAALAALHAEGDTSTCPVPYGWPWAQEWWKPTNSRRDLVKAGALILAEIERLDRANSTH